MILKRAIVAVLFSAFASYAGWRTDGALIASMDEMRFQPPKEKGRADLVEGKVGKAVRFHFDEGRQRPPSSRATSTAPPTGTAPRGFRSGSRAKAPTASAGSSSSTMRITPFATTLLPRQGDRWTKIVVAWRDLIPVLPGPRAKPLGTPGGNAPVEAHRALARQVVVLGRLPGDHLHHRRDPPRTDDRSRPEWTPLAPRRLRSIGCVRQAQGRQADHDRDDGRLAHRQAALGQPRGLLGRPFEATGESRNTAAM